MRPVRVLQVIDTLGMGGAETWLMEVLRLWARSGAVEMDLVLTSGNRGIFDDEAHRLGANLHYVPYTRRRLVEFVPAFRRILRQGRYDAIHDHQDYSAGWHFLMASGGLPPIRVVHVHNSSFGIHHTHGVSRSRAATAVVGRFLVGCYATHLTGTSRQILTEWGFDAPAYRSLAKAALYCGFDPGRFSGDIRAAKESLCRESHWQDDAKIVLVAGRMDESPDPRHPGNQKNTAFAVDVAIACMKADPRVRALFVGKNTPALTTFERWIAEAGMTGRFAFTGVRRDIEIAMLGADVLLFPSRGEGLGMVAVEAQAAGLPVLASTAVPRECVVVPDLVEFHNIEDGPDLWATQLSRLIALPRDVESANRRVAASAFSIERSARNLFDLYSAGSLPPDGSLLPQQA